MDRPHDRDWIRSLVAEYEGPLTIYAARFLGDKDRARDVVQDTFLKLWEADRAVIEGHVAQWLYRVCRNRVVDVCRKEHRMTTLDHQAMDAREQPDAARAGGRAAAPADGPGNPAEAGSVLALVATLPPRQQEVVRLRFQGGLSYREMAEVMGTTVNNVGVLLHTAIKTVRTRLAELAPEGDGALNQTPRASTAR